MDMEATCDALAARYAPGTIATPSGADPMRAAYGQAPHSMPHTPAVVTMPQQGTITYGSGQVNGEHDIDVLFYLAKAPGDIERVETQRQRWLGTLLNALHGQMALGLSPTITKAFVIDYEFALLPYGGDQYDGIRITVRVFSRENVTLTP